MSELLSRNVKKLRIARGISEAALSERLSLSEPELADALASDTPSESLIKSLSDELLIPDFLLFAKNPPIVKTAIPDFRLENPRPGRYSRRTLKAIQFAKEVQLRAGDLDEPRFKFSRVDGASLNSAALSIRERLRISINDQIDAPDGRTFYGMLRRAVEEQDVFVFHASFPTEDGTGFCLVDEDEGFDAITINTKGQSFERRSFTLAHELAHCVFKASGVSDFTLSKNALETRCNRLAAQILAPNALMAAALKRFPLSKTLDLDELQRFSRITKISMHAAVLRLIEHGVYSENAYGIWRRYVFENPRIEYPLAGGGRGVPQWKVKLARYGFTFARIFGSAKMSGVYDDIQIYRLAGLKPEFQSAYFANAGSASFQDAVDDSEY